MATLEDLATEIRSEFPDFKLEPKSGSKLMKAIGTFLTIVSFGKAKGFMDSYITTIGHTVYTSAHWDTTMDEISKIIVLRHERVHMRQQKRMGRFLFSLCYLLPFFPIGLAWGRAKLEMEAYTESVKAEVELRGTARPWSKEYQDWLASQFLGPSYLYMWPFPNSIRPWIRSVVDKAVDEYVGFRPKK